LGRDPYHLPVSEWSENDRPQEKLVALGAQNLSDAELLAILLRVGSTGEDVVSLSLRMLTRFGLNGLARMSVQEISEQVKGIGLAKATALKAALELGRRSLMSEGDERKQVRSAQDVMAFLEAQLRGLEQEHLYVMLLSTRNHILGTRLVYKGNISSSEVRTAEVFKPAIRENAASIIVAHNHPSGDPSPSPDDVRVTRDIVEAGQLLGVDVLDHVIVGDPRYGGFVSLRSRKLGFTS
jgi:DNA repair protein RadC